MIFKCYPGETPPHGRIDEVIYFFGIPVPSTMSLVPVAYDTVGASGVYWNGTIWVAYGSGLVLPVDLGVITTPDALADFMIGATATTQKPLVLQVQPIQTANAFEIQRDDGSNLFAIDASGDLFMLGGQQITGMGCSFSSPVQSLTGGFNARTAVTVDAAADSLFAASAAGQKVLVLQLAASPSNNAFEVQDSAGSVLFSIDQTGLVTKIIGQSAPSPAEGGTATLDGSGAFAVGTIFSHVSAVATWGVGVTPVGQLTAVWTGGGIQVYSSAGGADSGAAINWIAV